MAAEVVKRVVDMGLSPCEWDGIDDPSMRLVFVFVQCAIDYFL